jgi:hypothetical protein
MSLWSPAARDAYRARQMHKTPPQTTAPQRPPSAPPKPPASTRFKDSFTPAPPRLADRARKPELNPAPVRDGYRQPRSASELPPPGRGTGLLTINTANGAGDEYRDPANRQAQADLIRDTGASIVAFQEVDVNVDRSGNVNTALDIVARLEPSFAVFARGGAPTVDIHAPAPGTAVRTGEDGTTLYQTPEGTLVTGESFSGDDRGIAGDHGADATYGNALYVAAPERVTEAYTLSLPSTTGEGALGAATPAELAALADGPLTAEERARLGDNNEALRNRGGPEPRAALVTRVTGPDGQERTIINVHLASADDPKLREAQLEYLAQVVAAESKGPPAREVVVMGDFNSSTAEVGAAFESVGLERVVGGSKPGGANFDQVWTTAGLDTHDSAQVDTEGVSDHKYAGYTVID